MRVLMVSLDRGLFGGGHSGDILQRHKRYADMAGHLDIIVFASSEYERKDWAPNLRIIPTRSSRRLHYKNACKIAMEFAKRQPYDLLVTQDFAAPVGARLKKSLNISWIVNIHGMFFSPEWLKLNPLNWYLYYLIKKSIRFASGFRVNNEIIKNKLLEWKIKKPILVQPTPIDVKRFFVTRKPENEITRIIFVGRLAPEKNIGMLIKAVEFLEVDYELGIYGSGIENEKLISLATGHNKIKFFGWKTLEELPPVFQGADIFVLPSNTESFGQVLLQAAAARCAIVTTKTVGAMSILEDKKNALFVGIGDQKGMTAVLSELSGNKGLRLSLGENAARRAREFDAEQGFARTINFWKQIVSQKP
jgi:glycosyltransferase involved in cell wall biosynthesis